MTEKVEWEIVDEQTQDPRRSAESKAKDLLGPWWRWKVAGVATVAAVVLALMVTLAGVVVLFLAAATVLSLFIARFGQWLRGGQARSSAGIRRHWHNDHYR